MKEIKQIDKLYFVAILVCIGSFALPAYTLLLNGSSYQQFFINTYGGKVFFGNLLIFGLIIQAFLSYRLKKISSWMALICGAYGSFYAGNQLWNCKIRFESYDRLTLDSTSQFGSVPLAGIWILLSAGLAVLIIAAIKFANKCLSQKKLAHTTS